MEIFSCNLRAHLVSKKHEEVANTLDEMHEQGRTWYLMDSPLYWQTYRDKGARETAIPYPPSPVLPEKVQKAVQDQGEYSIYCTSSLLVASTLCNFPFPNSRRLLGVCSF